MFLNLSLFFQQSKFLLQFFAKKSCLMKVSKWPSKSMSILLTSWWCPCLIQSVLLFSQTVFIILPLWSDVNNQLWAKSSQRPAIEVRITRQGDQSQLDFTLKKEFLRKCAGCSLSRGIFLLRQANTLTNKHKIMNLLLATWNGQRIAFHGFLVNCPNRPN